MKELNTDYQLPYIKRYVIPELSTRRKNSNLCNSMGEENPQAKHEHKGPRILHCIKHTNSAKIEEENMAKTNEYLRMILTSEPLTLTNKSNIQNLFSSKTVRNYFCTILYQDKFDENKLQVLNDQGFEDLFQMIFTLLLQSENNKSNFEDVRLVTKSTFFYYK